MLRMQTGVMHSGNPVFLRAAIERFVVDPRAVDRRAGMEQFFGGGSTGAVLAEVMGVS